jgi:fluoride exporter
VAGRGFLLEKRKMKYLIQYLAIAAGGAVGAMARFLIASVCGQLFATDFPIGTMVINLSGSFFLGWFLTMAANRLIVSDTAKLAIATGFVGAYTTFSTYMFDSASLLKNGETNKALTNLLGSLILGMIAVWAGMRVAAK